MPRIQKNIKKNNKNIKKKTNISLLDSYIRRLANTKPEKIEKLSHLILQFDERIVLTKLCAFLENNTSIDGFRNAYDIIIKYGKKAVSYLEKLYLKPNLSFDTRECIIYSLFAIGERESVNLKMLSLYEEYKESDNYAIQLIIDMFELEMIKEASKLAVEFLNERQPVSSETLISMLIDFFNENLDIELLLRNQNDENCKTIANLLDNYSEALNEINVTYNNIEFFKAEEFLVFEKIFTIEEIIYSYEMSNQIANFIVAYKEENDVHFMPYYLIKGFVFLLIKDVVILLKQLSKPPYSLFNDLYSDAYNLFLKDDLKLHYEKLYEYFLNDLKNIYFNDVKPVNIDYLAWRIFCLTYVTFINYIKDTKIYFVSDNILEDDLVLDFIFNISEEITNTVENYIAYDNEKQESFLVVDENAKNYFLELIKNHQKNKI